MFRLVGIFEICLISNVGFVYFSILNFEKDCEQVGLIDIKIIDKLNQYD